MNICMHCLKTAAVAGLTFYLYQCPRSWSCTGKTVLSTPRRSCAAGPSFLNATTGSSGSAAMKNDPRAGFLSLGPYQGAQKSAFLWAFTCFQALPHGLRRFWQPRANTGKAARVFHKRMLFQLKKKAAADIISKVPPLRPSAWV